MWRNDKREEEDHVAIHSRNSMQYWYKNRLWRHVMVQDSALPLTSYMTRKTTFPIYAVFSTFVK
jgi:hypothetical protein